MHASPAVPPPAAGFQQVAASGLLKPERAQNANPRQLNLFSTSSFHPPICNHAPCKRFRAVPRKFARNGSKLPTKALNAALLNLPPKAAWGPISIGRSKQLGFSECEYLVLPPSWMSACQCNGLLPLSLVANLAKNSSMGPSSKHALEPHLYEIKP